MKKSLRGTERWFNVKSPATTSLARAYSKNVTSTHSAGLSFRWARIDGRDERRKGRRSQATSAGAWRAGAAGRA